LKILPSLALFGALGLAAPSLAQAPAPQLDLSVLYAGVGDASRTEGWLEFLRGHVRAAESIALTDLSAETAAKFDVVIVDSPSPFREGGGFDMPKTPELTREFTKPVILMGAAGGSLLRGVKIKLDWL
jgi:hypothetical protein